MAIKTVVKFSPGKFILNEVLRPGVRPRLDDLVQRCMEEFNFNRPRAERIVYRTLKRAYYKGLTWRDRDRLKLPNISDRYPNYPEICKYWKSEIEEPS